MLKPIQSAGFSMLEVLLTIVLMSFGLLGLAALDSRSVKQHYEAFQRAQAEQILADMTERLRIGSATASTYVTASPIGTSDSRPASCTALAVGAARDLCELSNILKGAAETKGGSQVGGLVAARACITQLVAANASPGICAAGVYSVTVVWQGLHPTVAPNNSCGSGSYGSDDSYRRALSARVVVPLPSCA